MPTIFGHSSIAWALPGGIPGQSVAVINLASSSFAGGMCVVVLAYFILDEIPHSPFYFASVCRGRAVRWL